MAYHDSTAGSGNGTNPSVAVPNNGGASPLQADDIVVLELSIDATAAVVDPGDWPAGFTELGETDITHDGHTAAIAWKRLTGADTGTYDMASVGSTNDWILIATAYRGRHTTNPPVISTLNVNNTNNSGPLTVSANGVTAVTGDDLHWGCALDVNASGAGAGCTPPASYTEREDAELAWTNLTCASRDNVSAGATGTVSGTYAFGAATAGYAAWLIRIPQGVAASGTIGLPWQQNGGMGVQIAS